MSQLLVWATVIVFSAEIIYIMRTLDKYLDRRKENREESR